MLLRVIGGAAFPLAKREKMLFQELGRASAGIVRISLYLQSAACIGGGRIKAGSNYGGFSRPVLLLPALRKSSFSHFSMLSSDKRYAHCRPQDK